MKRAIKRNMMKIAQGKQKLVAGATVVASSAVFADDGMDLTNVAFNTADPMKVGVLVLTAVAVLWGVRKAIAFGNKG